MKPKKEEQLVIDCLKFQGYQNITYEPDGNVPPDILLNDKIAVEVRRLNQNHIIDNKTIGLEIDEFKIYGILKNLMEEISDHEFEKSIFVNYSFERPLPKNKVIKKEISTILKLHKRFLNDRKEYKVDNWFKMECFPSSQKLKNQFRFGYRSDGDSGGFVVETIYENLKLIISEKENKIKTIKHKYPEWWLALVNSVSFELDNLDIKQLYELPKLEHKFDKIIIISADDATDFRFLYD